MKIFKNLSCILAVAILFASCEKNDPKITNEEGQVVFNISVKTSLLKSSSTDTSSVPKYLSVSIVDANGKSIFTLEKIDLLKFNTEYISKPISMSPGKYKLTNFLVLDGSSNIIYACPLSGSAKAYLVKQPLSIDFEISKDIVTKLNPEVLSTKESKAADFGYLTSTFTTVKTFDFLISAFIYNESIKNFELTTASVNISNETINYNLALDTKTNQLTVKDGFDNYTLTISKTGYNTQIINCTVAELKNYFNTPLKVLFSKTNTLVLQPGAEAKDAVVSFIIPNENRGESIHSSPYAWTQGGILNITRPLLDFNLSTIAKNTVIKNATLTFYKINYGNLTEHSGENSFIVKRITESWDEMAVTWNNQPATSSENAVTVTKLTTEETVNIDVTALVQDMVNNPASSHGFLLKLIDESEYKVALFASSDYDDATKHPKLVISLQ